MVLNKVKEKYKLKKKIVTPWVNSIQVQKAQFFFTGLAYQGKEILCLDSLESIVAYGILAPR
jgi:hypothetical protein